MRHTKAELYIHVVWATAERRPFIEPPQRRPLYRCLEGQAKQLDCTVLALGGMPDHVHMVLRMPTKVSVAQVVQQLKGVSSKFARDQLNLSPFKWQEGYGVFSLSRSHVDSVVAYVERQAEHHAGGKVFPVWEETYEETEDERPPDAGEGEGGLAPGVETPG